MNRVARWVWLVLGTVCSTLPGIRALFNMGQAVDKVNIIQIQSWMVTEAAEQLRPAPRPHIASLERLAELFTNTPAYAHESVFQEWKETQLTSRLEEAGCWYGAQAVADKECVFESGIPCKMPYVKGWNDEKTLNYGSAEFECIEECPNSPHNYQLSGIIGRGTDFLYGSTVGMLCVCWNDETRFAGEPQMSCEASWPTNAPTPTPQPPFMGSADCPRR